LRSRLDEHLKPSGLRIRIKDDELEVLAV